MHCVSQKATITTTTEAIEEVPNELRGLEEEER